MNAPQSWTEYMDSLTPEQLKEAALAEARELGRDDLVAWIEAH